MQKHPEIMFRLQVVEFALKHCSKTCSGSLLVYQNLPYINNNPVSLKNRYVSKKMLQYMLW
jgi:hypothetical protein